MDIYNGKLYTGVEFIADTLGIPEQNFRNAFTFYSGKNAGNYIYPEPWATGAATVGEVCVVTAGAETSTVGAVVVVALVTGVAVLLSQPTNIAAATAVITSVFILFSFIR